MLSTSFGLKLLEFPLLPLGIRLHIEVQLLGSITQFWKPTIPSERLCKLGKPAAGITPTVWGAHVAH